MLLAGRSEREVEARRLRRTTMKTTAITAKDMTTAATNPPTTEDCTTAVECGVLVFDGLGLVVSEVEPLNCMCRDDQLLHMGGETQLPCPFMLIRFINF